MDTALGFNCGPGMLLLGAQKHFKILTNLSFHSFGEESCRDKGIPTTRVSLDYSTWPDMGVSAAFGNTETWQAAQSFGKYVVARKIPIGILDVRGNFFDQYRTFFNELIDIAFKEGYRTCLVSYHGLTFNSAFNECRVAVVFYQKEMNFGITAPKLPDTVKNLYECIGDSIDAKVVSKPEGEEQYERCDYYAVNYEESLCIPKMRPGYTLRLMIKHNRSELPGGCRTFLSRIKEDAEYRDLWKPSWGRALLYSDPAAYRYLHPEYPRLLTVGEMMQICCWSRIPVGPKPIEQMMYGSEVAAGEWLGLQAVNYLQNSWVGKDFYLEYSKKDKKFKGGTANPLRPKKFIILTQYYNEVYREFSLKPRKVTKNDLVMF